jgi:ferrous iron transport protein B
VDVVASCHTPSEAATPTIGAILLVGNPNVGKSVIFGALTKRYVTVSNYPGTTVEITEGSLPGGQRIIDTPGTNSLSSASDDERVTALVLFQHLETLGAVLQVADAKNLQRSLLLTLQLSELGVPLLLNLNMLDEAQANGVVIDTCRLAERLGIDVTSTIATQGVGISALTDLIPAARVAHWQCVYEPVVEQALQDVAGWLPETVKHRRGIAVRLLCGDEELADQYQLNGALSDLSDRLAQTYKRPVRTMMVNQQMQAAQSLVNEVMTITHRTDTVWSQRLARWMIHPFWGWPILLAILWVIYKFVGELGAGTLVGFMEETVFGAGINPLATRLVDTLLQSPSFMICWLEIMV